MSFCLLENPLRIFVLYSTDLMPNFHKVSFTVPSPFDLYLPKHPKDPPFICITPLLGRIFFFKDLLWESYFARFFASHGFGAALIHRPIFTFDPEQGLEQIAEYLRESVSRNQKVLDFLSARKEVDRERVGDFGISFGAIVNCLWAARDPRLKAHVFALGGGNLAQIFMTSRDWLMRSYFKDAIKKMEGNKKYLKIELEKLLHPDPLEVCHSIPKESVLMVLALFDRVIGFRYGLQMRHALGNPKTILLPLGHYTSIPAIPFLQWRALDFFKKRLSA